MCDFMFQFSWVVDVGGKGLLNRIVIFPRSPLTFSIIPLPSAIPKEISSSATLTFLENSK